MEFAIVYLVIAFAALSALAAYFRMIKRRKILEAKRAFFRHRMRIEP